MQIVPKGPGASGAYPPLQEWAGITPPEGFAGWPAGLDTKDFYDHNGFVVLHIVRGIVESYTVNEEAWKAWQEAQPEPEPEPTPAGDVPTWAELSRALKGGVNHAE